MRYHRRSKTRNFALTGGRQVQGWAGSGLWAQGPEVGFDFRRLLNCATICIRRIMSENANSSVPSPTLALGKWLGLLVSAVVLAEGIWGTLVSLTKSLLLPLMARAIGGDAQSPLGKGGFNFSDLFVSVVELCLAGIVFLSIKIWVTRGAPARRRVRRVAAAPSRLPTEPPAPVVPQAVVAAQAAPAPEVPVPPPVMSEPPISPPEPSPAPLPPPAPTKAKKPEKPKEVYYNIVGEPITPEDE
jgi:hypothetical protein